MEMKPPELCKGCPYTRTIYTGPAVGYNEGKQWSFIGCRHAPYHGKWIKEIKECPKERLTDKQREVVKW